MSPSTSSYDDRPQRRFLLLPEQNGHESTGRQPIRRYRLASIARGGRAEGADLTAPRHGGERPRPHRG